MLTRQRGYTLIEVAIVVAIAASLFAAAAAFSMSQHARSLRASVQALDGAVHHAQAIASTSGDGATIVFAPRPTGGATIYVYARRPNSPSSMVQQGPAPALDATVSETTLGSPPFALFLNSAGHVSGLGGYPDMAGGVPVFSTVTTEPSCPDSGGFTVTLTVGQARDTRAFSCPVAALPVPDIVGPPP